MNVTYAVDGSPRTVTGVDAHRVSQTAREILARQKFSEVSIDDIYHAVEAAYTTAAIAEAYLHSRSKSNKFDLTKLNRPA